MAEAVVVLVSMEENQEMKWIRGLKSKVEIGSEGSRVNSRSQYGKLYVRTILYRTTIA
jgi:hypothetical protein